MNQYATQWSDLAWPVLQNLGFSGLVGIVCAVAFKVITIIIIVTLSSIHYQVCVPKSCLARQTCLVRHKRDVCCLSGHCLHQSILYSTRSLCM